MGEIAAPDQSFSETNNMACGASPAASASERGVDGGEEGGGTELLGARGQVAESRWVR
jgi:hypothetical protein